MAIRTAALTGPQLQAALADLARLRIDVFRHWPYLYDGSADYEQRYLERFAEAPRSLIVAAYDMDHPDGERMIGAATASPIGSHVPDFSAPLIAAGVSTGPIFYFGESVLLPQYRGHGIGHDFFDRREAHARNFPDYLFAAFCSVVRPVDHPLHDPEYRPLDGFWNKRGYFPLRGVATTLAWKDIDQPAEDPKQMRYWIRAL